MRTKHLKIIAGVATLIGAATLTNYAYQRTSSMIPAPVQKVNVEVARQLQPSVETTIQLRSFANANKAIVGVMLVNADFKLNVRKSTFRYFKHDELTSAWLEFTSSGRKTPLFGQDQGANQRLIAMINGEFMCAPVEETLAGQLVPVTKKFAKTVCMSPIPPRYGDFVGFISIFVNEPLNSKVVQELRDPAKALAAQIYRRDTGRSLELVTTD